MTLKERFLYEVCDGIVQHVGLKVFEPDGWYLSGREEPLEEGPFVTADHALYHAYAQRRERAKP